MRTKRAFGWKWWRRCVLVRKSLSRQSAISWLRAHFLHVGLTIELLPYGVDAVTPRGFDVFRGGKEATSLCILI